MDVQSQSGGAAPQADGAQQEPAVKPESSNPISEKTVRFDDHKRALDDMHRFKKEAAEAKQELERVKQAKLQEQGDYKSLWEKEQSLRNQAEEKYKGLANNIVTNEKYKAVNQAALKAGLRAEAVDLLEHIPLDGVNVETTSEGRFIIHGADTFVEDLKRKMPFAFQNSTVPTFNSGGTGATAVTEVLTPEAILKLQRTNPEEYRKAVLRFKEQQKKQSK